MPVAVSYPGVYIEEIPSGVRTITGVATSITAFIGRAQRGPTDKAVMINSYAEFERIFGGLWLESTVGYAVRDFYLNGGSQAIIVRLFHPLFQETERESVESTANEVATEAKSAATGAAAKTAANTKRDDIVDNEENTEAIKQAARKVAELIGKLPDNAKKEDVIKAADIAVTKASASSKAKLEIGNIKLVAASEGAWSANLRVMIDCDNIPATADLFNLTVVNTSGGTSERFLNLSIDQNSVRRIDRILGSADNKIIGESTLVKWDGGDWPPANLPDLTGIKSKVAALSAAIDALNKDPSDTAKQAAVKSAQDAAWPLTLDTVTLEEKKYNRAKAKLETIQNAGGTVSDEINAEKEAKAALETTKQHRIDSVSDGLELTINDFLPLQSKIEKKGMHALEQADLFNILCIPPYRNQSKDVDKNLLAEAETYCTERRALLIVDPHSSWNSKTKAKDDFSKEEDSYPGIPSKNAALFFPRLKQPNPLRDNQIEEFVPCGAVAGIFARTDNQRGVWKAPAGIEATLAGVPQLSVNLTDAENGELNPLGINCLRAFPIIGRVVWGSRTLRGADQLADEWKYIPVRRTALFIEESLYRGTKWVVFEPNDEPLWAQIRLNIGAFLHNLCRQGAFQGSRPR
ncbi:MAG: phage tail sheath family protein [Nitrosomonas sp.]|nr:MAG: phage tail sheath family protein [Nitrosomonas sp.]